MYFYYGLENYYQNHRRYMKSRSDVQLLGRDLSAISDCTSFAEEKKDDNVRPIVPCGAVANSLFNGPPSLSLSLRLVRRAGTTRSGFQTL